MSRFFPIHDPRWLLLVGVAVLAFATPILAQVRRLGSDVLEDTSTLVTSHVGFIACCFLGYRFTGLRGGLGMAAIWVLLSVAVHALGVFFTPRQLEPAAFHVQHGVAAQAGAHSDLSQRLLKIHPGWNLVSIPLRLLNDHCDKIFEADMKCWSWNARDQTYERPIHLTPGMAIWIHSTKERSVDLYGYLPAPSSRRLHPGWNLVGPIRRTEAPKGSAWKFEKQTLSSTVELIPGRGYWVYAEDFLDLAV